MTTANSNASSSHRLYPHGPWVESHFEDETYYLNLNDISSELRKKMGHADYQVDHTLHQAPLTTENERLIAIALSEFIGRAFMHQASPCTKALHDIDLGNLEYKAGLLRETLRKTLRAQAATARINDAAG